MNENAVFLILACLGAGSVSAFLLCAAYHIYWETQYWKEQTKQLKRENEEAMK